MHELEKIGNVVAHYHHHVHEHDETELSVIEFLIDHFSTTSSHEEQAHNELPFADAGHVACNHLLPDTDVYRIEFYLPVVLAYQPIVTASPLRDPECDGLFQPPRC